MKKKSISILLTLFICVYAATPILASGTVQPVNEDLGNKTLLGNGITSNVNEIQELGIEPEPDVFEVCNGKSYHDLKSRGWGTVYIGSYPDASHRVMLLSPCWQCTGCNLVVVTTGEPPLGEAIGTWASEPYNYPISHYGCDMWTDHTHYNSSSSMSAYHFRY